MFLAEEIAPVKAGLAGEESTWGRVPVDAGLDWVEPDYATVRVFFATDRSLKDGAAPVRDVRRRALRPPRRGLRV